MDILETMKSRHAVRSYHTKPIEQEKKDQLNKLAEQFNQESGLHIQICFEEPKAFNTFAAHYGKFSNVRNYIGLIGKKDDEEKAGYYGEKLVLAAQEMGLNTCWVAMTYGKGKTAFKKDKGEKILCVIALGYGLTQGVPHHSKDSSAVSSIQGEKPAYWDRGVEAALLAPTAVNQQKFLLTYKDGKTAIALKGLGFYTKIDLGIVKCHFEMAAGVKIDG